ncbi:MAG: Crp/Fnr family transcriptional regulator [Pseudomonadota bacterium]
MSMLASNSNAYELTETGNENGASYEQPRQGRVADGRPNLDLPALYTPVRPIASRRVSAGTDIIAQGDEALPYLLVLQGWAAPYKCLCDGRRQFFDILIGRDGMRGLRTSCDSHANLSIVALTDCWVWQGTLNDLHLLTASHSGLSFDALQAMFIDQHQRTLNRMTVLGHTRAPERVAYCLLELWNRQLGDKAVAGACCPLPLKQSDIGDATGLTGVHVCRTLSTFKKLGILRIEDGQLTVLRPDDLADIAGTDMIGCIQ